MSDLPDYDLIALQTLNGAELGPVRSGIPASEALGVLESERMLALSGEYGAGVMVFLRPAGEEKPNISELPIDRVFAAVARERVYQERKWGTIAQHPHEVGGWITLLRKELREAEDAWCSQRGDAGALEELLQVAAVAVACIQQHGIVERPQIVRDLAAWESGHGNG